MTDEQKLAALQDALARGVKSVAYEGGKRVEFQSRAEMKAAERDLLARINGQPRRRAKVRLAQPR
ncbi:phage head-tail joining protein [Hyphococcus sp.]|uniref:phage head-tail joining protein n=1 Tax=Hyphococcus sp. TaxID=2038636 RepID=UPI0020870B94|nr:MAG: hypothetical protein DHS20C04_31400 [Marinicaulis sp.]